mmetsp:Transcript_28978/g.94414  ORF Transcript_28978/g.94414 Transcript_28978/m.94414 type:complete len:226 (+) Transcript_28978:1378-2055(+)
MRGSARRRASSPPTGAPARPQSPATKLGASSSPLACPCASRWRHLPSPRGEPPRPRGGRCCARAATRAPTSGTLRAAGRSAAARASQEATVRHHSPNQALQQCGRPPRRPCHRLAAGPRRRRPWTPPRSTTHHSRCGCRPSTRTKKSQEDRKESPAGGAAGMPRMSCRILERAARAHRKARQRGRLVHPQQHRGLFVSSTDLMQPNRGFQEQERLRAASDGADER